MLRRLRTDFQLTIITLFGACGAIGVYRAKESGRNRAVVDGVQAAAAL